jgi:hypothetical protein
LGCSGSSPSSRDHEQGDEPDRGPHRAARLVAVPIDILTDYWFVVVNLLAGRLIGASIGAAWATQMRSTTIYRVLAALLLTWAARSTRSSGGRRATRRDYGT